MTALQEVIAARDISQSRLIASGLLEPRVRELMAGAEPSVAEVRILAKSLHLPIRDLIVRAPDTNEAETRLRTNFGRKVPPELDLESRLASDRIRRVSAIAGESTLPYFKDLPKNTSTAEELSRIVRNNLLEVNEFQPLLDIHERIFSMFGVCGVVEHFRSIEGVSTRAEGAAIVLFAPRFSGRTRFTFSHEVCHLLTDLEPNDSEIWLDEDVLLARKEHNYLEETFANAFAASLLLPLAGVLRELKEWRKENNAPPEGLSALEVMHLARTFGTSFVVTGSRLEAMQLLPEGGTAALQKAILEHFASAEKFADFHGLTPEANVDWKSPARALAQMLSSQIQDGSLSREWLAEVLGLAVEEVMRLNERSNH